MDVKNFAYVDKDNIVTLVITGESLEQIKRDFPTKDGRWIETFPGVEGKVHAGVGDTYDDETNNFVVKPWFPDLEQIAEWGYPPPFEHLNPENQ
jgi:hypothetical protein